MYTEKQKQQRRDATKRWRLRHPEKYKESQKKRKKREYDSGARAKWYGKKKTDVEWKEMIKKQNRDRKRKILDFLKDYKLSKGCADCGYSEHHSALDFDHVTGIKKRNVCMAKSMKQAKEEIEKCEVVCSNCHRIRTFKRLFPQKEKTMQELLKDPKTMGEMMVQAAHGGSFMQEFKMMIWGAMTHGNRVSEAQLDEIAMKLYDKWVRKAGRVPKVQEQR